MQSLIPQRLMEMYERLLSHFGPQFWWPAETPLEVMVGAILTQNTNWNNVEKAIINLKKNNHLTLKALSDLDFNDLAQEIRPAGYYNVKARRIKNLIRFIVDNFQGDFSLFLKEKTITLRENLLTVKGIGPETADSILLYALKRPVFVIDTYTHRILRHHNIISEEENYHSLQNLFIDNMPKDQCLFNEFHALIVQTGKTFCKKKPKCDDCPLYQW